MLKVPQGPTIHFFAVIPLYREELECCLNQGTDALCERLNAMGVNELLDPQRPNVCAT